MAVASVAFGIILLGCLFAASIAKEDETAKVGTVIGTTNSCVGVYKNDDVEIVTNDQGNQMQGRILSGEEVDIAKDILLRFEVLPFSHGIETVGGVMTKLIPRGSMLPIKKSQVFTTCQDRQTTVTIQVYEGNCRLTKDCRFVGKFDLSGIPPAPRGTPQIEVTFLIDANGILNVRAEDKASGKVEAIEVINHMGRKRVVKLVCDNLNELSSPEDRTTSFSVSEKYVYGATQAVDSTVRKHAEDTLKPFQEQSLPGFLLSLSGELAREEKGAT